MGVKVAKFGGSSVADAIQFKKTKEIVLSDKDRRYVVVSAPGKRFEGDTKITDVLYLCKAHIEHNLPYEQLFQVVIDRYMSFKINLGIEVDLQSEFDIIKKNLHDGIGEAYIASRGEYLSAVIIAAYLGYDLVDTVGLIRFDKSGALMFEETDKALKEELSKHERAVMPGFYGSNDKGEIVTFSRGGSDVTGSLIARAVNADVYENWTDVSGFMMADPRIVDNPEQISQISYKELRELSYMGASVLHEDAIYPAKIANIPINIRNTNEPYEEGTYITAEPDKNNTKIITGIAGNKDFTVIALYKNLLATEKGYIRKILNILEDYDVSCEHIPSGIDTVSIVISNEQLDGKIDRIIKDIKNQLEPDSIEVFDQMALIATVGCGMSQRTGVSAKLFTALAENDVNIRMIDQGSSEMNIIVGVENKQFESAIRAIYQAFME
ncbi:MAG: aspartate kinase [Peptostreptococcaceae bacterium]|nr:aspartate kinase [Peptostreptococcaceae bacterium]